MQRLRKWLAAFLLGCSITIAVFWLRTNWACDQFAYSGSPWIVGVNSADGYLLFYIGRRFMPDHDRRGFVHRSTRSVDSTNWDYQNSLPPTDRIGNWEEVYIGDYAYGADYRCFVVPDWKLLSLLTLMLLRRPLLILEAKIWHALRPAKVTA